ncbi:MAG: hypothetical protein AAFO94_13195 [Bacteroidota bacterium]
MQYFAYLQYTWFDFLVTAGLLAVLYLGLQFAFRLVENSTLFGRARPVLRNILYYMLLLFEPLVIVLLVITFIFINPPFHGLLVGVLFVLGFRQIRDYFSGRIVLLDNTISIGSRLSVNGDAGLITQTERLGLKLRNKNGLKYVNYSRLLTDGYTLLSGEQVGGFYELKISKTSEGEQFQGTHQLLDQLTTVPYLDFNHRPDLRWSADQPNQIQARLMIREERHLSEFFNLLREWGYTYKIAKK